MVSKSQINEDLDQLIHYVDDIRNHFTNKVNELPEDIKNIKTQLRQLVEDLGISDGQKHRVGVFVNGEEKGHFFTKGKPVSISKSPTMNKVETIIKAKVLSAGNSNENRTVRIDGNIEEKNITFQYDKKEIPIE